ncbi:MAG: orotate phosphoribosyltransferase [Clostridia bacterium]|nr:orotate phosphoribosyltransferase [Clostridia bacterium]
MSNLVSYLFKTNAFKVCPDNKPFWYTSGKIGPYFINTHFLYGSEESAVNFLNFIDIEKDNKIELPKKVLDKTLAQYNSNSIYKEVIDEMISFIKSHINIDEIDYVSGGERRDWFFSNVVSYLLEKPHITIFKDLSTVISTPDFEETKVISELKGKKVLHVADLVTAASSYVRAWIPAIQNLGSEIVWSTVVVDRMQGGNDRLKSLGIDAYSLVQIAPDMFKTALDLGIISEDQNIMLNKFFKDPDTTMKDFLIEHPEFLENALKSDEKTVVRARLCIEGDLYGLKEK